jgi:16S rRNA (adenine1518-N6/adenine1519-N6)-dimethyltransferase
VTGRPRTKTRAGGRRDGSRRTSATQKSRPSPRSQGAPGTSHRPRKRFGQHFLADAWARRIVDAIRPEPGDVFLEIGPGLGALTRPLAESGVPILAVEIDRDLVVRLARELPPNVTVLSGDILETEVVPILTGLEPQRPPGSAVGSTPRRFRIVGNLPYNVASPILSRLVDWYRQHLIFSDATVMVQREMADRLTARPGTSDYGVLTVLMALRTTAVRVLNLPPGAFSPPPKVRSSVVRLAFGQPAVRLPDEALFERMVKALFSQRRKTLANAIKRFDPTGPAVLALSGLDGRRRPETLHLAELAHMAEILAAVKRPPVL